MKKTLLVFAITIASCTQSSEFNQQVMIELGKVYKSSDLSGIKLSSNSAPAKEVFTLMYKDISREAEGYYNIYKMYIQSDLNRGNTRSTKTDSAYNEYNRFTELSRMYSDSMIDDHSGGKYTWVDAVSVSSGDTLIKRRFYFNEAKQLIYQSNLK